MCFFIGRDGEQKNSEIKGRIPNAVCNFVFVYLSNIENISFEQVWKELS